MTQSAILWRQGGVPHTDRISFVMIEMQMTECILIEIHTYYLT